MNKIEIKSIEKKGGIKFVNKDVPTGVEICSNQLYKMIDKIENVEVDEKQIKPFLIKNLSNAGVWILLKFHFILLVQVNISWSIVLMKI